MSKRVTVEELLRPEQDFELLEMGKRFCAMSGLDEHVDDDALLMTCIGIRLDVERNNLNAFIAYIDGEPVGFIVGVTTKALHRKGVVAEQKLWYVEQSARGSLAAKALIRAYEDWARLNGATQLYTGTAIRQLSERTSKLLEKLGYARVGALHVKEI